MWTETLWSDIYDWMYPKIFSLRMFSLEDIYFGLVMCDTKEDFLVNTVLILPKFFIHKCKYSKVKPKFCMFHNDFVSFSKTLKLIKTKNALKLSGMIEEYNLCEKP